MHLYTTYFCPAQSTARTFKDVTLKLKQLYSIININMNFLKDFPLQIQRKNFIRATDLLLYLPIQDF